MGKKGVLLRVIRLETMTLETFGKKIGALFLKKGKIKDIILKQKSHLVLEGALVLLEEDAQMPSEPIFSKESLAQRDEIAIIRGHIKISL